MTNKEQLDKNEQQIAELTADLQRTRADFENYRKRMEAEKAAAREAGHTGAILRLLPVIDTIERAAAHVPEDLRDNTWVKGVIGLEKNLQRTLGQLDLEKVESSEGMEFNPELHEAVQFDEESTGEKEVIAEVLQPGYLLNGRPVRPAMVRVKRQ